MVPMTVWVVVGAWLSNFVNVAGNALPEKVRVVFCGLNDIGGGCGESNSGVGIDNRSWFCHWNEDCGSRTEDRCDGIDGSSYQGRVKACQSVLVSVECWSTVSLLTWG